METQGLGGRIGEEAFREQFRGLPTHPPLACLKNRKPRGPAQIQAVTGATISTRSILAIINRWLEEARRNLGGTDEAAAPGGQGTDP